MPLFEPEGSRLAPPPSRLPSGGGFAFGPYELDVRSRQLLRDREPIDLSPRQFDLLHALVSHAGEILSKDVLIKVGWKDLIVGDSSLEKMIFQLRRRLDPADDGRYIQTVPRRGYRLSAVVTRIEGASPDVDLSALLAPYRAWIEGRAALETLEREQVVRARAIFEELVRHHPGDATFHVGLANAYLMQFEATRTDLEPDVDALGLATEHSHLACRLRPDFAEAWATLGFVLARTGQRTEALASLGRALSLERDNWLHQCRYAAVSWGEDRLHAVRKTLTACPHLPIAHLLAASVHVARGALGHAEREVDQGLAIMSAESHASARFSGVALHGLKGLLCLARRAEDEALALFDREIALEAKGHVYGRESSAHARYAKGAVLLRRRELDAARAALGEAVSRMPRHTLAHAGLTILDPAHDASPAASSRTIDLALARAVRLVWADDVPGAVGVVAEALASAPPGDAGWLIPIDPLLRVWEAPEAWAPVLTALHVRAR